jgi:hypothetical protein
MRKMMICLLGLALMLVLGTSLVLTGCGTSGDGTETYTDSDYGFSFDYPSDWQVISASDTDVNVSGGAAPTAEVSVGDPEGKIIDETGVDILIVRVYELNATIDDSVLPQVVPELENLIASLQAQDPSLEVLEPLAPTTVGGLNGYEFTASFEWSDGTPMMTTSYFVFDGSIEYQLVVQAAEENWEANQVVFDTFVSSFQPGEGAL